MLAGIGVTVWLGIVLAVGWYGIVFWAIMLGTFGARIGSLTRLALWQHKLLLQIATVVGAMLGVFLGIYLVHGFPMKGDFGWPVVACSAALALVGLVLPMVVLSKLVPVSCARCGGPAYLGTDSTFFRNLFAKYDYRCRSCGQTQEANFSQPLPP
jgi:hypothetical protein